MQIQFKHNDSPMTLGDIIRRNAVHHANEIAWVHGNRVVTHREFAQRALRIASAWKRKGLRNQDRVAVLSMNAPEICEVFAAGELSGIITATVNFRLAGPEIQFIVNDAAPRVFVFEAQYAALVDSMRSVLSGVEHFICIGERLSWAEDFESVIAAVAEPLDSFDLNTHDIAHLIYTSGTTGRPKGVMLEQGAQARIAEALNGCMKADSADRILLMMPMFHVGAKAMQLGQHWRGGAVYLHRSFDPEAVLQAIQNDRITITHMAPTMIQMLLAHPRIAEFDLSSLRMLVYSAAPMPTAVLKRGLEILGPIFTQLYGLTEGTGTVLPAADHDVVGADRLRSVGTPFPGVALQIFDENDQPCPAGTPGEIVFRGATIMRGYWNNTAASIDSLRGGWLHTGDIGQLDEDGYVYLVDRKKDMIVSGGENIYSREVEEALYQHRSVCEAAVVGVPDPKWGEAVCAIVQLQPGATLTEATLIEHCRALIAAYKRPKSIIFVSELPKLPSGKINKRALRNLYGGPSVS